LWHYSEAPQKVRNFLGLRETPCYAIYCQPTLCAHALTCSLYLTIFSGAFPPSFFTASVCLFNSSSNEGKPTSSRIKLILFFLFYRCVIYVKPYTICFEGVGNFITFVLFTWGQRGEIWERFLNCLNLM